MLAPLIGWPHDASGFAQLGSKHGVIAFSETGPDGGFYGAFARGACDG